MLVFMRFVLFISTFLWCFHIELEAQVPAYYQSIDFTLTGDSLKSELATLITSSHHSSFEYTSNTSTDTWDIIKSSDTYLLDCTKVFLVYGYDDFDQAFQNDLSRDKSLSCHGSPCDGLYNREHVYAKSLANPSLSTSFPGPGTDVHNLRTCDYVTNTWRGNRKFGPANGNAGVTNDGFWYPGDEWKGDIARMMMYMYLRYPNQCPAMDVGAGASTFALNGDMPDVFLTWNVEDPVSTFEQGRNDVIASFQGNRNPFIDNPFLATVIWNGPAANNTWLFSNIQQFMSSMIVYNPSNQTIYCSNGEMANFEVLDLGGKKVISRYANLVSLDQVKKGIYFIRTNNAIKKVVIH